MLPNRPEFRQVRRLFRRGLNIVEYAGLLTIAFATTYAMGEEAVQMVRVAPPP